MRAQHVIPAVWLIPAVWVLSGFSVCAVAQQTEYATVVAETAAVPWKIVSYGDLNLQRHEGVTTLYRRIRAAANDVCSQFNNREPQVVQRERTCASDATGRAVAKVGIPALVTLHAQQAERDPAKIVVARDSR